MLNNFFVARQPIFDKKGKLWGFELLFRTGLSENSAVINNPDAATLLVASNGFLRATAGLPDDVKIFINFTEDLIFKRFPLALPPQNTVVEILENIPVSPQLIERLKELKSEGYVIALDDFVGDTAYKDIFPYIDIIKLDCLGRSIPEILEIKKTFPIRPASFWPKRSSPRPRFWPSGSKRSPFFRATILQSPRFSQERSLPAPQPRGSK